MRTIITWTVLLAIEANGFFSGWLLAIGWWRPYPHSPINHFLCGLWLMFSPFVAFLLLFFVPAWMSGSAVRVKRAIEDAYRNNYETARFYFCKHRWIIFPRAKYNETVRILRHLCIDRKTKPIGISPEFADCIVPDDFGNYVLSSDGKEKMIKKINTGSLTAQDAENLSSPKTMKILMRLAVIVAVIRGIALIMQLLSRH